MYARYVGKGASSLFSLRLLKISLNDGIMILYCLLENIWPIEYIKFLRHSIEEIHIVSFAFEIIELSTHTRIFTDLSIRTVTMDTFSILIKGEERLLFSIIGELNHGVS